MIRCPKIKYCKKDFKPFNDYLNKIKSDYSSIYILADTHTLDLCVSSLLVDVDAIKDAEIFEVNPGELSKDIEIATGLWLSLSETGADRSSLLINVGGGVVTDLGGWVASTFKRGIDFIHVPTSLLGMVDAAIGGKTGIDLEGVKRWNRLCTTIPTKFKPTTNTWMASPN